MLSLSIRWSSSIASTMLFLFASTTALAEGEIEAVQDRMMTEEELTLRTIDRVLDPGLAVTPDAPGYDVVQFYNPSLPDPYVVPMQETMVEEYDILPPEAPEKPKQYDTWLVFQDNSIERAGEAGVYEKINREWELNQCLPGFDCPVERMQLPAWPEDSLLVEEDVPNELFDVEIITPFNPIPELSELPFPTN